MSKHSFEQFELQIDQKIKNLPIMNRPLRTVLTFIYSVLDGLFNGPRLPGLNEPDIRKAVALSSRLSYLINFLLRCPVEPIGANAYDTVADLGPDERSQISMLLAYAHFCEIMPAVWKNHYMVEETEYGFLLDYPSDSFRDTELKDIILADLSLGMFFHNPGVCNDPFFDVQAVYMLNEKKIIPDHILTGVSICYRHHLYRTFEQPIMTDQGFKAAVGATYEEFNRFRAAWMAVADYCLGMANAFSRMIKSGALRGESRDEAAKELLDWTAVFIRKSFLKEIILSLTALSADQFNQLLQIYSIDPVVKHAHHTGDGFFPPLFSISDSFMFNPNVLQLMLSSRNIPYALNRLRPDAFNNLASQYMEPQLIQVAFNLLLKIPELKLVKNYKWGGGEFDLLVYDSTENAAFHMQAKGAIPPEGARMTQRIEQRFEEGIRQLQVFHELGSEEKDRILSKALGFEVKNVKVLDLLLGWSCFGTYSLWSRMGRVIPVNLALLYTAIAETQNGLLSDLADRLCALLDKICREVEPRWDREQLAIGDKILEYPTLNYQEDRLIRYKTFLLTNARG